MDNDKNTIKSNLSCSFCGSSEKDVNFLIEGDNAYICDICIDKANEIVSRTQLKTNPEVIAISKTFKADKILPLLEAGHIHYGENKIQETEDKWVDLKKKYKNIKLHLVGKLQSNKAKKAVMLFDYIHSLDNIKLATKINQYENELNKKTKIFIQVNVAEEEQKSGILLKDLNNFYSY